MDASMSDPLSILRDFSVRKQNIATDGDLVIFGDTIFEKTAKTRYMVDSRTRNDSAAKTYYTLESLLCFLDNVELSHSEYEKKAVEAAPDVVVVHLADRTDLLAYLKGEVSSSANIDDDFIPDPADLPVPSEPVADKMEETFRSSAATAESAPAGASPSITMDGDFIPDLADLPVSSEPRADNIEETSTNNPVTAESTATGASDGEKPSDSTDVLVNSDGEVPPSISTDDDFVPDPADTPVPPEPATDAMEETSSNIPATVEPTAEVAFDGEKLSDRTDVLACSNGAVSPSTRFHDDFFPDPADTPVTCEPVTGAMEATSGSVPATVEPAADIASNGENRPAADLSPDFTWLLVSALRRLDDPGGATVLDVLWQVKQSFSVQSIVQTANMRLKKLIPHLIRESLPKNIIEFVPGVKPRRYKLATGVNPADFPEPPQLLPTPKQPKRKADADGLTKNQRKKLRIEAAAHVVNPVCLESESAAALPVVPSADSKLLTATIIDAVKSLRGSGNCTADAVFKFAAGVLQKVKAWPALHVDMVQRVMDKGVETGLLNKVGEEYHLTATVIVQIDVTDRGTDGVASNGERTEAMEETSSSVPATVKPTTGSVSSGEKNPAGDSPPDFTWLLVSVLRRPHNAEGATVKAITAQIRRSYTVPLIVENAKMTLRKLIAHLIRDALAKNIIQVVPEEGFQRYKLDPNVNSVDILEPEPLLLALLRKQKSDATTRRQRKKMRNHAAAPVVERFAAEGKVWNSASADVLPDLPSADCVLLRESLRDGNNAVDGVFTFGFGEPQRGERLPPLDVVMARDILDEGVEAVALNKEGVDSEWCQNGGTDPNAGADFSDGALPNETNFAFAPASARAAVGVSNGPSGHAKLQPTDFIPAVISTLYTSPAGLTLDEILLRLKKSFSEPLLNDAAGMKMDQFVALTIGQALMKKEIQRANNASEPTCRYKANATMTFHDFRGSPALDALRLGKKREISETDKIFRKFRKMAPRLTSLIAQKRKHIEDSAKIALVRENMGNLPLVQREELRSLVDGALKVLEEADNCSILTVYGSVVTLNQVRSCRVQYSFRHVQSMLQFGINMGFYALEKDRYRLVNEANVDGVREDAEMETGDQIVDHWEAERQNVDDSAKRPTGPKTPPVVRKPRHSATLSRTPYARPVSQTASSTNDHSRSTGIKAGFFRRQPKSVCVLPSSSESVFPAAMFSSLVQDQGSASALASSAATVSPVVESPSDIHGDPRLDSPLDEIRSKRNGHSGSLEESLVCAVTISSGSSGFSQRQSNMVPTTLSNTTVSPVTLDTQETLTSAPTPVLASSTAVIRPRGESPSEIIPSGSSGFFKRQPNVSFSGTISPAALKLQETPNPVFTSPVAASVEDISPASTANCGFFKRQPNGTRGSPSVIEAVPSTTGPLTEFADVNPLSLIDPSSSSSNSKSGFFKRFCRTMPASATAPIT